ncbi:MAG: glycosyltransferase [Bacillus subtilis]|nr:glycosyltransferase [Bacillus subtilis]
MTANPNTSRISMIWRRAIQTKVRLYLGYNNRLAHRLYAASDLFLMPSKFEPCGLGQLIALKYGSLPLVRETGGLIDTVKPYNEFDKTGNGFSFSHFNAHDMMHVLRYALSVYQNDPFAWDMLVERAMNEDFSWNRSADEYIALYKILKKEEEGVTYGSIGIDFGGRKRLAIGHFVRKPRQTERAVCRQISNH